MERRKRRARVERDTEVCWAQSQRKTTGVGSLYSSQGIGRLSVKVAEIEIWLYPIDSEEDGERRGRFGWRKASICAWRAKKARRVSCAETSWVAREVRARVELATNHSIRSNRFVAKLLFFFFVPQILSRWRGFFALSL